MGARLATLAVAMTLAAGVDVVQGADVDAEDHQFPAAELLEYGPESPSQVLVADLGALADTATGLDALSVTAIAGPPALRVPFDPVPWLDADAITEFAHFGPTGMSTADGEPMITVVATTQDRADLAAALEEAGWMAAGENTFESDAPFRDVASANWVYIGDGVVIWAPHSRHLDVALDVGVETSIDLPIIEALARAEGNRRLSIALDRPSECGGVVAAGDDAGGGGTFVLAVGDTAEDSRVEVDEDTYFDRQRSVVHAIEYTVADGYLVVTTAVDDPELRSHQWSTTTYLGGDTVLELDELYRC